MSDIIFDACMKYENYPIKIVGEDVFYNYYILYQNFKNSPKIKKWSNRQKSMSQMRDIILVACLKCKSYSIKTVGEDAFCSYYISTIISKIRQKYLDHQKKNKPNCQLCA